MAEAILSRLPASVLTVSTSKNYIKVFQSSPKTTSSLQAFPMQAHTAPTMPFCAFLR